MSYLTRHLPVFGFAVLCFFPVHGDLRAAEISPAEAANKRLRDGLKNANLQLQTLQAERATLQAAQAESEQKIKELNDSIKALNGKLDALTKQSATEKAAAEKDIADLNTKVAERDRNVAILSENLDKWKNAYKKATDLVKTTEAERAKRASQVVILERKVAEQQTKNDAMYKIGSEILTRYEKFGLGTALTAREPFTGLMRVKLENLVQDYSDKLTDEKIKPDSGKPVAQSSTPAPAKDQSQNQNQNPPAKPADRKSKP